MVKLKCGTLALALGWVGGSLGTLILVRLVKGGRSVQGKLDWKPLDKTGGGQRGSVQAMDGTPSARGINMVKYKCSRDGERHRHRYSRVVGRYLKSSM